MSSESTGAIAERYSAALFDLAEEQGYLDSIAADLKTLKALIDESGDLRRLLRSPVLSRAEQQRAVEALAVRAGLGHVTRNFLGLVARRQAAW